MEQLKAQQASLHGRIESLGAKEQAAQARVDELQRRQQQLEAPATSKHMQRGTATDSGTSAELRAQLEAVQNELATVKAELGAVEEARSEAHASQQAVAVDAAASAEQVALLRHQLQAVKQAAAASEEALAEERRRLQQCRTELAASQDVASTQRLQQDIAQLQAHVRELRAAQAAPAEAAAAPSKLAAAASTPNSPLQREGALVPRTSDEASTPAAHALVVRREQSHVPAVWEGTPTELADARRELHALQLRIAVACADEARLTAACAELRRQQATAEHDVMTRRQQASNGMVARAVGLGKPICAVAVLAGHVACRCLAEPFPMPESMPASLNGTRWRRWSSGWALCSSARPTAPRRRRWRQSLLSCGTR